MVSCAFTVLFFGLITVANSRYGYWEPSPTGEIQDSATFIPDSCHNPGTEEYRRDCIQQSKKSGCNNERRKKSLNDVLLEYFRFSLKDKTIEMLRIEGYTALNFEKALKSMFKTSSPVEASLIGYSMSYINKAIPMRRDFETLFGNDKVTYGQDFYDLARFLLYNCPKPKW